ncbi:hypothetical protein T484DRAFT_1874477 [Baffinella frigidus]|nr:hypothetical protein T484DRAFT_1874477 [Cryptophyta sp. CCMP2293]
MSSRSASSRSSDLGGVDMEARGKKKRTFAIENPNALPGWGFICLLMMSFHYIGLAFMFFAGVYHNPNPAPAATFLIACFTTGCTIGLASHHGSVNNARWISLLVAPRSGMFLSLGGHVAGSVYAMLVFGTQGDFKLATQLITTAASILLYYLLVRRRLAYAGSVGARPASLVFSNGAVSVSRVRSLGFRTFQHAIMLGIYTCGWCLLYTNLIDVPVEEGESSVTVANATAGVTANATAGATNSSMSEVGAIPFTSIALPKWVKTIGEWVDWSDGFLRFVGKAFLIFNLYVVSNGMKASVWLSVSSAVVGVADAVRHDGPVKIKSGIQLNVKLKTQVPSVFIAAHLLMGAQILRCAAEAFRRSPVKRQGWLHNIGAFAGALCWPVTSRITALGLSRVNRTGVNMVLSSQDAWDLLFRTGMDAAINDDLLFGSRVCVCLLAASASSVGGSTLVALFGFPTSMASQVGMMCFIASFLNGNWGMEVAEAWAAGLFLEFAEEPETIYITNPRLANEIHSVMFGCSKKIGPYFTCYYTNFK